MKFSFAALLGFLIMTLPNTCQSLSAPGMPCAGTTKTAVQKHYAKYVTAGGDGPTVLQDRGEEMGYTEKLVPASLRDAAEVVFQASCGSGCPLTFPGAPQEGETVLDAGCGAGHDVLLASHLVGASGKVIGVDFTPEMINAAKANVEHHDTVAPIDFVEASLMGDISKDIKFDEYRGNVDVVISNGVFNLCDCKQKAFENVFELLKPGGRFLFSDACKLEAENENPEANVYQGIGDAFSS